MFLNREKKDVQKCVRMTKTTYNYVLKHDGEGFNEKFSNMVNRYETEEKNVNNRIKMLYDEEKRLLERVTFLRHLIDNENRIESYLQYIDAVISHDMPTLFDDKNVSHD